MHDPLTQILCILTRKTKRNPYGKCLAILWHKDPELDGHDDSCGWHAPNTTCGELKRVHKFAEGEMQMEVFWQKVGTDTYVHTYAEPIAGLVFAFQVLARSMFNKGITPKELVEIMELASNPYDNLRMWFDKPTTSSEIYSFYRCVYKNLCRMRRPWYRHPRWHVHHWRVRIPFFGRAKRSSTQDATAQPIKEEV